MIFYLWKMLINYGLRNRGLQLEDEKIACVLACIINCNCYWHSYEFSL